MQNFKASKYIRTIVLLITILVLSTATFRKAPGIMRIPNGDKIAHVLMYAFLGLIFMWEYSRERVKQERKKGFLFTVFFLFVLYSGLIELIQEHFTLFRSGEWLDWLANTVGLIIGYSIGAILFRKKEMEK